MTAKEYLSYLPNIQLRIKALQRSIRKCEEVATTTGGHMDSISSGQHGGNGKVAYAIEEKCDLEQELRNLMESYQKFAVKVVREINRIPNNLYVTILIDRYVNGLPWETVAANVGMESEKHVRTKLHEQALTAFEKNNPESTGKYRKVPCFSPENDVE